MIDLPLLVAFVAAASILTITPGADTAMVLRLAATDGPRPAVFAAAGIALGCLAWGLTVSLGLGALLTASPVAYTAVQWAGAAYLVWLGAHLMLKPRQALAGGEGALSAPEGRKALQGGLLTNLLNPKVGVFYLTFLPQFIPARSDVAVYSFGLAVIHVALTLLWFAVLIAAIQPLGRLLRAPRVVTVLDRLTGGVFIAFGLKLALSRS